MANIKHVNSVVDRDFRNRINQLIDIVNDIGTSLNDLVVKGVMTTEQYSQLITAINGLVKIGEINKDTLSVELKNEIEKINNKIDKGNVSVADINKNLGKLDQTFLSDELLQQIAGTANINATVADNSVTTQKLTDKSVTGRKTDFIKVSSNLLNPNKVIFDKSFDTAGNIIDDSGYFISDLIPFDTTKKISFSLGTYRINLYDASGTLLFRTGVTNNTTYDASKIPNVAYFRISRKLNPKSIMLNYGDTLKTFENYYEKIESDMLPRITLNDIEDVVITPENEVHFKKSNNLFNKYDLLFDKGLNNSGEVVGDKGWVTTRKIKINGDKVAMTTENTVRWAIYDKDDNLIAVSGKNPGSSVLIELDNFPNAEYFILTVRESVKDNFMANYGTTVLPHEDFGYTLVSTNEIPIRISSDIVPEISNTSQLSNNYSDTYLTNRENKLYETTAKISLDYIELTTNQVKTELILTYKDSDMNIITDRVINPTDNSELPMTIENIVSYGYPNVEYLIYDPTRSQFKIAIKQLNFSNGVTVSIKNNHSAPVNATTRLVGRYYD